MPKLLDLEMAVDFVSSAPFSEHVALLSRSTGEIYYHAEFSDFDELPDDADESEDYLELPHKNDLHPGHVLVWRFVRERLPEREDTVRGFFARRGAYSRYKSLLHEFDLLEEWYEFENGRTKEALLEWCGDNGVKIEGL